MNASRALLEVTGDPRRVRPLRRRILRAEGVSLEDLLVRWLSELLHRQQTRGWLVSTVEVDRVDRTRFRATGRILGEPYNPARHVRRREVKAVTYHQLRLVRGRSAWRARIVLDV